ncbi:hypothetical protein [Pandoraea sp. ISTKB]|uniref:hypothetical protein n=1 Tax=Pandoraea sp. ISTKB TaxID=1586708 RepID=UPI000846D8E4|nr:hypothetical protein [Pandoraea sp. ISTKB]ODP35054.1 hypothetical protein A9762_11875 [Pandoraea sp. ISTKB]
MKGNAPGVASTTAGAHTVLRVLQCKAFYKHRFLEQVSALFDSSDSPIKPQLAASLYLGGLLAKLPEALREDAARSAAETLVAEHVECPAPSDVRMLLAAAALRAEMQASGDVFAAIAQLARIFLAAPPSDQKIADGWLQRVLYTATRRVGHERFLSLDPAEWRCVVADVVFADESELLAYHVKAVIKAEPIQRDFRALLRGAR